MPQCNLNTVITQFNSDVNSGLSLAVKANNFKEIRQSAIKPIFASHVNMIVELSFLRIFISWEEFLGDSFLRYMCGAASPSGFLPIRYIKPYSLEHASNIIRGAKPFIDWTNWSEILRNSDNCFQDGEPFRSAIGGSLNQLNEMKIIRNRIAHTSELCDEKFHDLVRQRFGSYIHGMTPGRLLQTIVSPTTTLLQEYAALLKVVSRMIVP